MLVYIGPTHLERPARASSGHVYIPVAIVRCCLQALTSAEKYHFIYEDVFELKFACSALLVAFVLTTHCDTQTTLAVRGQSLVVLPHGSTRISDAYAYL